MLLSRRLFFALVAVSTLASDAARAAGPHPANPSPASLSPADVVRALYAASAGRDGRWKGPSALDDAAARRAFFTEAVNAAYTEEKSLLAPDGSDRGALTFNPISNTYEGRIDRLKVVTVKQDGATAEVAARFHHRGSPAQSRSRVTYELVRQADQWKVDDIVIEFAGGGCEEAWTFKLQARLRQSIDEHKAEKAKPAEAPAEAPAAPPAETRQDGES